MWWAWIGKVTVWLLAWSVVLVILRGITLAVGEGAMFQVYRSVVEVTFGGLLLWWVVGPTQRATGREN